jgi:hypothetical protein
MTTDILVVTSGSDVAEVARIMHKGRRRAIPIVGGTPSGNPNCSPGRRPLGTITRRDLMRCISRLQRNEYRERDGWTRSRDIGPNGDRRPCRAGRARSHPGFGTFGRTAPGMRVDRSGPPSPGSQAERPSGAVAAWA